MSAAEQTAYEDLVRKRMARRERSGDARGAASESYNLGVHFRSLTRGRDAFRAYRRAARLDPRYGDRAYFSFELAGVLFELGWSRQAAKLYSRAIESGADGIAVALLADSLLWAGCYRASEETLDRYLVEARDRDAEWRLKRAVLPLIRRFGGDEQIRHVREALALSHLNYDDVPTLRAALERALRLDACCGEAWFNYAFALWMLDGDLAAGADAAVTSAVLHRTAVGAWTNAIMAAGQSDTWRGRRRDLLRMAYRFNGEALVQAMTAPPKFPDSPPPDPGVLEMLNEVIQESQRSRSQEGFTMRFHGDDDESFEIDMFPPDLP